MPRILIYLRYDDYCAISDARVDEGLVAILQRHGLSCTFGVVPAMTSGEPHAPGEREEFLLTGHKLAFLQDSVRAGVVEAAVHGWNHRTHHGALPPAPSEFAGLSLGEQHARIERACVFLEHALGERPATFIPPWNSYDVNTVQALEQAGMRRISANREGPVVESSPLIFTPMTVELSDLRSAVDIARRSSLAECAIGVMMHPYDFTESGDHRSRFSLSELESQLRGLKNLPDTEVGAMSAIRGTELCFSAECYGSNRQWKVERAFPPMVRSSIDMPVYLTTANARADKLRRCAASAGVHVLLMLLALVATAGGLTLLSGIPFADLAIGTAAALAAVGIALRAVRSRAMYFRAAAIISLQAGIAAGALLSLF